MKAFFLPTRFFETTGMLDRASSPESVTSVTSNVAFASGSSQHGNARLASAASNWVVTIDFFFPDLSR